jgi:Putative adhesin
MKRVISLSVIVAVAACASVVQAVFASRGRNAESIRAAAHVAPAVAQDGQGEFRWHGALAAGRVIEIKGVNGSVVAEPSTGGEVEVVAVKRARRSDPESVHIDVVQHGDGVTICAVYPNVEGREPNTCAPGDGGHMNTRDNDVSVNFTVRVPAGVRFTGRTVNGKVEAENMGADVDAATVNGSIRVSTNGIARAKTVNGSIAASMGRADWTGEMDLKTVNGGIDVSFPESLSATVEAKTLNGEITSDFPLTVTGSFNRHHLSGTVGGGGRELRLETVNGSVQIHRAS